MVWIRLRLSPIVVACVAACVVGGTLAPVVAVACEGPALEFRSTTGNEHPFSVNDAGKPMFVLDETAKRLEYVKCNQATYTGKVPVATPILVIAPGYSKCFEEIEGGIEGGIEVPATIRSEAQFGNKALPCGYEITGLKFVAAKKYTGLLRLSPLCKTEFEWKEKSEPHGRCKLSFTSSAHPLPHAEVKLENVGKELTTIINVTSLPNRNDSGISTCAEEKETYGTIQGELKIPQLNIG